MSRSKHTRPKSVRAADRLREPREGRGAGDPSRVHRQLRELKELGIVVPDSSQERPPEWSLPRIVEKRPRSGCFHPAGKRDVARVLRFFGEECSYGVRSIELRQGSAEGSELELGRLFVPGRIVLYDQRPSPWRLRGSTEEQALRLERAGAELERLEGGGLVVSWPEATLKAFMLFDVLMHEIGHHLLQHHKGKRSARIARTRDHEAYADAFALKCRAAYGRAQ